MIFAPGLGATDLSGDLTRLKHLSMDEIMQIKIPTVYGASKHEQEVTDAPSSVTIVTRNEIQLHGHRHLADILRTVRDFYVTDDRNYGYIGVRGVNRPGDFGGRILLLVDGMRLNDPIYDSTGVVHDFPVDVDLIERVEVIRGPGSALYGNNAFFAVINVITRSGSDVNGAELSAEGGTYDTFKGRFTYGKRFQNGLSVLLSGTLYDSGGNDRLFYKEFDQPANNHGVAVGRDDDSFENLRLKVGYKDLTLQAGYVSRRKDVPTGSYGTTFNDSRFFTLDQRVYAGLTYAHDFRSDFSVRANLRWSSYYYKGDYPSVVDDRGRTGIFRDIASAQWWGGEFEVSKQLGSHHLTLGAEFQDNAKMRVAGYNLNPYALNLDLQTAAGTAGMYLQEEWAITPTLTLTAGLRYDLFEDFDSTLNPRAALVWHPWKTAAVKLLYGQAYRVPNMYESSYYSPTFRDNPDLEPERIRSYEIVFEQNVTPNLRVSASGFYNQMESLISEREDLTTGELFYENGGRAETKGASLELEAKLPKGIKARASYTWQRTTDEATGQRFSNSPEHLAKLSLTVPLYSEKIFTGFDLQYSSQTENLDHRHTPGFVVANWTLFSRELVKNLEVSASIYNLFDAKYGYPGGPEHVQESIEQDGRSFRIKATYRF